MPAPMFRVATRARLAGRGGSAPRVAPPRDASLEGATLGTAGLLLGDASALAEAPAACSLVWPALPATGAGSSLHPASIRASTSPVTAITVLIKCLSSGFGRLLVARWLQFTDGGNAARGSRSSETRF